MLSPCRFDAISLCRFQRLDGAPEQKAGSPPTTAFPIPPAQRAVLQKSIPLQIRQLTLQLMDVFSQKEFIKLFLQKSIPVHIRQLILHVSNDKGADSHTHVWNLLLRLRMCVKSLRSSYTGLHPQTAE